MREAHAHLFQLGRSLSMCDLSASTSAEDAIESLATHARTLTPGAWVLAHGARPESWDDPRWVTRTELDHACDGRPACVWCFDYHALAASTTALTHASIDASSVFEHGRVELDGNGEPTGLLLEHAALALWDSVPEPEGDDRRTLVREACAHLAALGFTEVHDLKAQPWLGGVLTDLLAGGEIDQRVTLFPLMDDLDAVAASRGRWHPNLTLGGGKIFTDGTLNSRTAWVLHPWADAPADRPNGTPMMTHEGISDAIERAGSFGLPIAAHAIGDAAVRTVLDAVERSGLEHPGHRIEHAELIDAHDVPRFAELGVTASLQPCHLLADIEALRRACPDRLSRVLPIRELITAGLVPGETLIFGSDAPIVRADHTDSVLAATMRRRAGMDERDAVSIEHAVSEREALACFGVTD